MLRFNDTIKDLDFLHFLHFTILSVLAFINRLVYSWSQDGYKYPQALYPHTIIKEKDCTLFHLKPESNFSASSSLCIFLYLQHCFIIWNKTVYVSLHRLPMSGTKSRKYSLNLGQKSANIFCRGEESNHIKLCRSYTVYCIFLCFVFLYNSLKM